jgi:RNA polymerase sigma factor (sigma-70 family)
MKEAIVPPVAALNQAPAQPEWWQQFREGNRDAFALIYHTYVDDLYSYGLHFCGDAEKVKDCLQELFQDLWHSRQQLAETVVHIRYYLLTAFRRNLLRSLQKDRRWRKTDDTIPFDFECIPPREHHIIQDEIHKEQLQQLHSALATLTRRQREAIYLRFFQNLSYQEVADIMGMKVDSVYNLISKAIGLLKEILALPVLLLLVNKGA